MADQFQSAVRWLRRNFPVAGRVYVKLAARRDIRNPDDPQEYSGHDGLCRSREKSFLILIASDMQLGLQIVTLDHEWAHLLAFPKEADPKEFHTDKWAKAQGKIAWQRAYGAIAAAREKRLRNP